MKYIICKADFGVDVYSTRTVPKDAKKIGESVEVTPAQAVGRWLREQDKKFVIRSEEQQGYMAWHVDYSLVGE